MAAGRAGILPPSGVVPFVAGHAAPRPLNIFAGFGPWHRRCFLFAQVPDLGEEAVMRHRTRTTSLLLFLFLLLFGGVIALPLIPEASADGERADWAARIAEMDRALARGETAAAAAAWREAYVAAHVSRGWPGMLAVGDAALRAAGATGTPEIFEPRARRAYLTALLRAHRQASREGVLAAGEAFGRLGDREAERLARAEAAELAVRAEADARRRARAL